MVFELKHLTLKQTCRVVGFSRWAIARMVKIGKFPKPIKIGCRRIAWLEEDLKEWMEQKKKER